MIIKLPTFDDGKRGALCVAEALKAIPFVPVNIHWMYNLEESEQRGGHAHRTLKQVIFAVNGYFRLTLDDGKSVKEHWLDEPNWGVMIPPLRWDKLDKFSKDCVILSIASDYYDPYEYIHDKNEFLELVGVKQ